MIDNTKTSRIYSLLHEAKEKGVKEVELFDDLETANNTRVIKHRLLKILGSNGIEIKNGIWYLDEEYWNMTKSEFKDTMNRHDFNRQNQIFSYMVLCVVAIMSMLVTGSYFIGKEDGAQRTIQECGVIFDTELRFQDVDEEE